MSAAEKWLTIQDVADEFDVSTRTVRRWINGGYLKAQRLGPRLIRIASTEVDQFRKGQSA